MSPHAQSSALLVRPLVSADLVAVAQCIALDVTSFPHPSARFAPRAPGAPVWVARRMGAPRVVGFLAASALLEADLYIDGLAVDEGARRLGVGRALVRAAMAFAREARAATVTLHVWTGNRAGVALYRSEGFDVHRRLVGYYRPGSFASDDAYRMVRALE